MRVLAVVSLAAFGASAAMAVVSVAASLLTGTRLYGLAAVTIAGAGGAVIGAWGGRVLIPWLEVILARWYAALVRRRMSRNGQ